MPLTEGRYRRVQIEVTVITAAIVLFALAFLLYVLHESQARRDQTIEARIAFCKLINDGREQAQADAWEDYKRLDQTLELLNLQRTPAIVERARADRDRKLDRARTIPCELFARDPRAVLKTLERGDR